MQRNYSGSTSYGGYNNSGDLGTSDCTVYFSGAPQSYTERDARRLFESAGHIQGLRLLPNRTKPIMDGYVDFSDPSDAKAAVDRLNGHLISPSSAASPAEAASVIGGEFKLLVQLASNRKRPRNGGAPGGGGAGGRGGAGQQQDQRGAGSGSDDDNDGYNGYAVGPPLNVPQHYRDPVSQALRKVSMSDAFEAVEQLRVISLERPEETRELLEQHPALKVAVVEILQIAGKLPTHLPQDAFKVHATNSMRAIIRQEENKARYAHNNAVALAAVASANSGYVVGSVNNFATPSSSTAAGAASTSSSAAAAPAAAPPTIQMSTEQLVAQVEKLTEAQLNKLMAMKPEEFEKVKEPKRSELRALQHYLLNL